MLVVFVPNHNEKNDRGPDKRARARHHTPAPAARAPRDTIAASGSSARQEPRELCEIIAPRAPVRGERSMEGPALIWGKADGQPVAGSLAGSA